MVQINTENEPDLLENLKIFVRAEGDPGNLGKGKWTTTLMRAFFQMQRVGSKRGKKSLQFLALKKWCLLEHISNLWTTKLQTTFQ